MSVIKVIKKSEAAKIIKQQNSEISIGKYDGGKYEWTGSQNHYIGKEVNSLGEKIKCVWVERRNDSNGAYAQIMCAS